ncbi:hypothetical protein ND861_04825 [Leptospira sp. 2 VSF19]|uniref:Uncharacterized protein n=1 Tax=Leptospira soteropolitanensis TaxID=2950025 RepID=A0AAW5VNR7_9LEPT|nr:hypothetical protein [Leptospira soteropolitanensis]MCW7491974.1 hypothetical protein [Leptospira soteropolitanensis]MCW7499557.1 hypothetical protein [Leptospira soteropolitanensis]MCW7521808.1 hypothetical protein [Leptospira soteropolitanensis]MCW7525661.1 hypothetical protein [Leptospira soteropolitanensis]MCW7530224.1 hypothetical protein [Leptospira soteropolitanensis]
MEINIKNNAGELRITTQRLDSDYKEIEYSIELDPAVNFELLFSKLEPNSYNISDAHWINGYKGKLGIIRWDGGITMFSGLRDLSINTKNLRGSEKQEFRNEHFHLYLKSFINRFIYLDEIIKELKSLEV